MRLWLIYVYQMRKSAAQYLIEAVNKYPPMWLAAHRSRTAGFRTSTAQPTGTGGGHAL